MTKKQQKISEKRGLSRRERQKRLYLRILGFCLFTFLLGFFFGRVVLAAERRMQAVDLKGQEAEGWNQEEADQQDLTADGTESASDQRVQTKGQDAEALEGEEDWRLILVNGDHLMPEDYEVELTEVGDGHQVDSRIARALLDMLEAGEADGHAIWIASSYRTMEKQTQLYENKVAKLRRQGYSEEEALKEAATVVAIPGTSEHQLGLAVDLVSSEYTGLDERQERTKSYQWLVKHCAEYGFILRYPNGKTKITGIIYEPWHFRYVGVEAAKEIMEQGVCLEEYLEQKKETYE